MYDDMQAYEAARLAGAHTLLREKMLFMMPEEGDYGSTLLHGFTASRWDKAVSGVTPGPAIGLVVQGNKQPESEGSGCSSCCCFVEGLAPTSRTRMVPCSFSEPYLALTIELDGVILNGLIERSAAVMAAEKATTSTVAAKADSGIVDAYLRLMNLMDKPELFVCLAPFIIKEIHFRMLIGPLSVQIKKLHVLQMLEFGNRDYYSLNFLHMHQLDSGYIKN